MKSLKENLYESLVGPGQDRVNLFSEAVNSLEIGQYNSGAGIYSIYGHNHSDKQALNICDQIIDAFKRNRKQAKYNDQYVYQFTSRPDEGRSIIMIGTFEGKECSLEITHTLHGVQIYVDTRPEMIKRYRRDIKDGNNGRLLDPAEFEEFCKIVTAHTKKR